MICVHVLDLHVLEAIHGLRNWCDRLNLGKSEVRLRHDISTEVKLEPVNWGFDVIV